MGIDAKPPVRQGSGAGYIVLAVVGAALSVPLLIVVLLLSFYGLARSSPSQPAYVVASPVNYAAPGYEQVSPEFDARLNAANRIQVTSERDEALGILAADFAQSADEANRAIRAIQDNDQRDTASWNAARRFSELNRPQDSIAMIENMLDQTTRDAAFRAVATGSWPERQGDAPDETSIGDAYSPYATAAEGLAH